MRSNTSSTTSSSSSMSRRLPRLISGSSRGTNKCTTGVRASFLAAALVGLSACGGDDEPVGAVSTCFRLQETATDYRDGALTVDELLIELGDLAGDAERSETNSIALAAVVMSTAVESGNVSAVAAAIEGFDEACEVSVGL